MTDARQLRTATVDRGQDQRCAACAHDLADHDPISLHYCQATQAQASSRGSICPTSQNSPQEAVVPGRATGVPAEGGQPTETGHA
jgi:hypothetical protein